MEETWGSGHKFSPSTGFLIQVGPKNPDDAPVRLDLNPECLTPYGFAHMIHTLTGIIQIDLIWVQLGRVTRVDAALDVNGWSPNDFAWDISQRRKRQVYLDAGELRTLYIGGKHGDWLTIYDKARQLKLPEDVVRTRIGFRKRRAGPVLQLPDLDCPFADLLIFDPSTLKKLPDPLRAAVMTVGQTKGMKGVLALFPPKMRPELKAELLATTPEWWKPKQIWQEWPIMVKASLPGLFDLTPGSIALAKSHKKL